MNLKGETAFLRVLRGERVDPPPVWMMRQAGRYLPEYRETRKSAGSFLDLCFNPTLAAEVTLQPIRRFGFDAAILFSDILVIPYALNRDVRFEEGVGPLLDPLASIHDLEETDEATFLGRLSPVFEAIERIQSLLPRETPLIGFCGAPWTLATYMIAGRGTPDQAPARKFAIEKPEEFRALISRLEAACIWFLRAQIAAGVDCVKIFDSWAGSLPVNSAQTHSAEPIIRIAQGVKERFPNTPIICFPKGAPTLAPIFDRATEIDCLALDAATNPDAISFGRALQGNLDPMLLTAPTDQFETHVDFVLNRFADRAHIFNLGHGITPDARIEAVERMLARVRSR